MNLVIDFELLDKKSISSKIRLMQPLSIVSSTTSTGRARLGLQRERRCRPHRWPRATLALWAQSDIQAILGHVNADVQRDGHGAFLPVQPCEMRAHAAPTALGVKDFNLSSDLDILRAFYNQQGRALRERVAQAIQS